MKSSSWMIVTTDGTVEVVLQQNRSLDRPIRIIRRCGNSGGPARPINEGIRAATSEIIAVLDQDDIFVSGKIAKHVGILERHPEVTMVSGSRLSRGGRSTVKSSQETYRILLRSGIAYDGHAVLDGATALRLLIDGMFVGGYPGSSHFDDAFGRKRAASKRVGGSLQTTSFVAGFARKAAWRFRQK